MIYELRVYRPMPGKMQALLRRFEDHTLAIWERMGIRLVGFWTTMVGQSSQELTYVLAWENMAEFEVLWKKFSADAEWIAVVSETERDGPIVQNIASQLLRPTAFSPMK
jgi:hypothetical protein